MKKIVSMVTALVLLIELASCNIGKAALSKVRTVLKESEWWNDVVTTVTPDEIRKKYSNMYDVSAHYFAADEDSVVLSYWINSKEKDTVKFDNLLRRYSYDGELLGEVSIEDYFGKDSQFYMPETVFKMNDKYYAVIKYYSEKEGNYSVNGYEIDFDAGTLKESFPMSINSEGKQFADIYYMTEIKGKMVYLLQLANLSGDSSKKICVFDGKNVREFMPEFGSGISSPHIWNLMNIDDSLAFIAEVTENGRTKELYCTLDIDTFEMKTVETDPKLDIDSAEYVPGKGLFDCENRSIVKKDPVTGKRDQIMSLDDSFIGGLYEGEERVLYASDEKVVIFVDDQSLAGGLSTSVLVTLTRADSNPNAGKKVLSLAKISSLTNQEYLAVADFNRNSNRYFLEVNYKYYDAAMEGWKIQDPSLPTDLNLVTVYEASAVDLLCSDIRAGAGPDLVIYNTESAQLNSTDYLIDLTKRIDSEKQLSKDDYMKFVFEPNGRDGKHYRLDYGFEFDGFLIKDSLTGADQQGLTYEQYDRLVSDNNGMSVLYEGDLPLFKFMLMDSDYLLYDKEGKFTAGTEGFARLAGYVANIPEVMQYDTAYGSPVSRMRLLSHMTFAEYANWYSQSYKGYKIVGIPSSEGHAETIKGFGIGITSCCPLQDGAWEFVMKMMSPEIQLLAGYYDPVLISAQRASFENFVALHNSRITSDPGIDAFQKPINKEIVDWYIDQISDAVTVPDTDSSIMVIMNEEMPAYFEGQKSLDDVIKIIENRVNLMLSERS